MPPTIDPGHSPLDMPRRRSAADQPMPRPRRRRNATAVPAARRPAPSSTTHPGILTRPHRRRSTTGRPSVRPHTRGRRLPSSGYSSGARQRRGAAVLARSLWIPARRHGTANAATTCVLANRPASNGCNYYQCGTAGTGSACITAELRHSYTSPGAASELHSVAGVAGHPLQATTR